MPNIEIKTRFSDLEKGIQTATKLGAKFYAELHQVDTYFRVPHGRLKLRESNKTEALLIPYLKENQGELKKSNYALLPVEDPAGTKALLAKMLGQDIVVDKQRTVYLLENIRIHFDRVQHLGTFLEFEAVYKDASEEPQEREKVRKLMIAFGVQPTELLNDSYPCLLQTALL